MYKALRSAGGMAAFAARCARSGMTSTKSFKWTDVHDYWQGQAGDFAKAKSPAATLQENSPGAKCMCIPYAPGSLL